jgi:tetratricopeptide (TPR) repeat protein
VLQNESARVGLDPLERVFLMENHDQAYHVWRDEGSANKILIHIDAHHDMWWADGVESVSISNFISLALKNDVARAVFWVVPDGTWRTEIGRQAIRKHVWKIVRTYPGVRQPVCEGSDSVSTSVLGKPLTACALDSLPVIEEGVLLDIDVDFLVIARVSYGEVDGHGALPWCWPADLVARLRAKGLRTDLATVVHSVNGGYTPLKWKYLGDELALRLARPAPNGSALGLELIREAAESGARGDIVAAEETLRLAATTCPTSAAAAYHLAHLYEGTGRIGEARRMYRQALERDPAYRSAHSNVGFNDLWANRVSDAEREFRRALSLDHEHAGALYGLGVIASRRKRWSEAEGLLRRSLASDDTFIDAHRRLAALLARRGEYDEATSLYERSLILAMAGHKPLGGLPSTAGTTIRLLDADHWKTHARLARLYERKGNITRAIAGYRISLAAGYGGTPLKNRLARLSLGQQVTPV